MKYGILICSTFAAIAVSCNKPDYSNMLPEPELDPNAGTETTLNIVANAKMEEDVPLELVDEAVEGNWSYIGGWNQDGATVMQHDTRGYDGSRCLVINGHESVDVGFAQVIKVVPGTPYKISARIKAENVSGGAGAHLSLDYLWAPRSEPVVGTTDWKYVTLEIEPETETVTLALKLGNTSADASGVAYFDNVSVSINNDLYVKESKHIKLMIDKSHVSVSDELIEEWLGKLDQAYVAYQELFKGKIPYESNKFIIRAAPGIDAWAYAGYPIQWNSDYIESTLLQLKKGDWIFGILHEMGHNFAPGRFNGTYAWNFNEELFANFRMYYVLDKLNATIVQTASVPKGDGTYESVEKTYVGKEIMTLYKSECDNGYDRTIAQNRAVEMGNALCYCLGRIVDKYGWDLWKDTFEYLYDISATAKPTTGMTGWDKFEYLMDALTRHNYEDVHNSFTQAELNTIKAYLETQ